MTSAPIMFAQTAQEGPPVLLCLVLILGSKHLILATVVLT